MTSIHDSPVAVPLLYKQGPGYIQHTSTAARHYNIALHIRVSNCQLPRNWGSKLDLGSREGASPENQERQRPFRTYRHKVLNGYGVCQVCLWCMISDDAEIHLQR